MERRSTSEVHPETIHHRIRFGHHRLTIERHRTVPDALGVCVCVEWWHIPRTNWHAWSGPTGRKRKVAGTSCQRRKTKIRGAGAGMFWKNWAKFHPRSAWRMGWQFPKGVCFWFLRLRVICVGIVSLCHSVMLHQLSVRSLEIDELL